jgi:uncharacterized protein YjbI with pentapeptide repeats
MEDQPEQHRKWWQQLKKHRVAIRVGAIVLVVVIVVIIIGYWLDWTGFNGYNQVTITRTISGTNAGTVTRTEEYQPGKALWDWLQLLIIPLVLAVGALLFNFANSRTEQNIAAQRYKQDQQIAEKRYEQDQQIALDKQREDLLHIYLDSISELLLNKKLRTSKPDAEVRIVARVRTITILFQLDARRIGYVFAFLREAGLMSTSSESIVSLKQAYLNNINFSQAVIDEADLREAYLSNANLSGAMLYGANLSGATLYAANLSGAYLYKANLSGADLHDASISCLTQLDNTLHCANLTKADLRSANLSGAVLSGANLDGANLNGARVTEEQLKEVKSLVGATMPDGSIHP